MGGENSGGFPAVTVVFQVLEESWHVLLEAAPGYCWVSRPPNCSSSSFRNTSWPGIGRQIPALGAQGRSHRRAAAAVLLRGAPGGPGPAPPGCGQRGYHGLPHPPPRRPVWTPWPDLGPSGARYGRGPGPWRPWSAPWRRGPGQCPDREGEERPDGHLGELAARGCGCGCGTACPAPGRKPGTGARGSAPRPALRPGRDAGGHRALAPWRHSGFPYSSGLFFPPTSWLPSAAAALGRI